LLIATKNHAMQIGQENRFFSFIKSSLIQSLKRI